MSQTITPIMKSLRGTIIKIKYYNKNNCFSIFIMKCPNELSKKGYSYITCKGSISEPSENTILILNGNFITDETYGEEFKFDSYENSDPLFEDEIITYLSNGLIKEVDYTTAQKIYNQFKNDTIYILDNEPEKLMEIKGIGKLKYKAIINSWKQHRENLQIHLLFQKLNISLNIIEKIKKIAKARNLGIKEFIIKYNYTLIYKSFYMTTDISIDDDIDDIKTKILSFNDIDLIIKSISNELFEKYKKSYDRIQAAIYTCIQNKNYENGYTCQPYNTIINMVSNNLFMNFEDIDNIFKENYNESYIIFENNIKSNNKLFDNNNNGYLYCIEDYKYEVSNSNYLSTINIGNKNNIDNETLNSYIKNIEEELKIKYNENQINAIKSSINNNITIITGGPGTGKTTIIKGLINILINNFGYVKEDILLLAPTGKAAKRLMESTNFEAHTLQLASWCKYEEYIYPSSIIIIDEASMIGNKLLYQFLRHITKQKLIFVGDIYQLPSISPGNILGDLINCKKFPVITLKQIYRQENGYIILNAHNINNGIFPILNKSESNDFFYINNKYIDNYNQILDKILNIIYNNICNNDIEIMKKELQILSPMKNNGDNGVNNINNYMQLYYKNYNYNKYLESVNTYDLEEKNFDIFIEPTLLFKFTISKGGRIFNVGDKVINTVNDYENMIFNGETGIISKIEISENGYINHYENLLDQRINRLKDSIYDVYVLFDDNEIKFTYEKLDSLQLSYALTIHKSQGSEYKWVIIFLNKNHNIMLQRNLLYTAITRAKEKVFLISDDETIQKAIINNDPNIKLTLLKERLMNEGDESYQKNLEKVDKNL